MHTLTTFSARPCLLTNTDKSRAEFMNCVRQSVESSDTFQGEFKTGHAMISIVASKRHFWSPWMQLEYREMDPETNDPEMPPDDDDPGRVNVGHEENIIARFSPHPSIWTGFMLSYLSLAVLTFFSVILGVSQQLAKILAWGYYGIPVCIAFAFMLWIASQIGQRLAIHEMESLIKVIQGCLGKPDASGD